MVNFDRTAIQATFDEVLEKLAFMFVDVVHPEQIEAVEEPLLKGEMRFKGPMQGSIAILAPASLTLELASNILGLDPEEIHLFPNGVDALGELLNVVCGHILTTIAGEEPVFELSVPETNTIDAGQWADALKDSNAFAFSVEGTPMILHVSVTGEPR